MQKERRLRTNGRWTNSKGYVLVLLRPSNFFYSMVDKDSYIKEHRLVMAKHLGRCLHSWEIVHHKGTKYPKGSKENKSDNRFENLQLISAEGHNQITILENKVNHLISKITQQELQIKTLQWQIKDLRREHIKT